jgi:hypothetical protein
VPQFGGELEKLVAILFDPIARDRRDRERALITTGFPERPIDRRCQCLSFTMAAQRSRACGQQRGGVGIDAVGEGAVETLREEARTEPVA